MGQAGDVHLSLFILGRLGINRIAHLGISNLSADRSINIHGSAAVMRLPPVEICQY